MNNTIKFTPKRKQSDDYDLLDVNEFITGNQEGFIAYRVTGTSDVDFIKSGYIVFANAKLEPQRNELIVSQIDDKNCVSRFQSIKPAGYLGVIVGHLSVYGK